jgi:hypothetical protein
MNDVGADIGVVKRESARPTLKRMRNDVGTMLYANVIFY